MTTITELALEVYSETAYLYRNEGDNWFAEVVFTLKDDGAWSARYYPTDNYGSTTVVFGSFADCLQECFEAAKTYHTKLIVEHKTAGRSR